MYSKHVPNSNLFLFFGGADLLTLSKPKGVAGVTATYRTCLGRAAEEQKESMGMRSAIYKQATPTGFGEVPRKLYATKDVGNDKD